MITLLSYLKLEVAKSKRKKRLLLFLVPTTFGVLYFYGFYVSFIETFSVWKHEITHLDSYTFWAFNVIDITSVTISLFIILVVHQAIAIDSKNWQVFNYIPINIIKVHFAKIVLGVISVFVFYVITTLALLLAFLLSKNNLFVEDKAFELADIYILIESIVFFLFAYGLCFLLKKNKSLWVLIMAILLMSRHIIDILPGSFLYNKIRLNDLNFYWVRYYIFCVLSFTLLFLNFFNDRDK